MERIKNLNLYQKVVLLLLSAMLVFFTVVYFVVSSRVGFEYKGVILCPQTEEGNTVYAGRIQGKDACFTVTGEKIVTFQCGEKAYGPYTAREDPSAVPEDSDLSDYMTGVEIRQGEDIFFRGGVLMTGGSNMDMMLFDEDGSFSSISFSYTTDDGVMYDSEGGVVDQMAPSASTILHLMNGHELTSKGEWLAWFSGFFISVLTVVHILFADELFRWSMALHIRNAHRAEPSDLEIVGRYISWISMSVMALIVYIMGLTT